MNVKQLIKLLQKAPQDAQVFYVNNDCDYGEDNRAIEGLTINEAGEIEFCDNSDKRFSCPVGVKTYCQICGRGCRTIWLVLKDGKATWIEDNDLRGPHDTKNNYEFFNPHWIAEDLAKGNHRSGLINRHWPKDAPLPEYNKETDTYRWDLDQ